MEDIAPELYEKLKRGFETRLGADQALGELDAKIKDGAATYRDAEDYAVRVGNALAGSFRANLSSDVLPDGRMYYNIATRTVVPLLREDYSIVSAAASRTQEALNRAAHIGLKPQTAEINEDRIDGLIERLTEAARYDEIAWILDRPVVNFSQSVVDDTIEANADFHARAGLNPKIVREAHGQACAWCMEMAGTYDYPAPKDVYRRHKGCTCVVEYYPGDGRIQNAHTKAWREEKRRIETEERIKTISQAEEKTFVQAKTIEEAAKYASETLGIDTILWGKMNLDVANMVNRETENIYQLFGNLHDAGMLSGIRVLTTNQDYTAAYHTALKEVLLKRSEVGYKSSLRKMEADAALNKRAGFWSTACAEHQIRHELGHAVQHQYTDKYINNKGEATGILREIEEIREDVMRKIGITGWNRYDSEENMLAAGRYLSYYGLKNNGEFIAESIAEYVSGNPREIAVKVVELLKKG